ncbi:Exocyst complex component, exo70 subunit [Rhodotorula toruloides ATCC 204091]|uniref:Exocyst complex protein EXO70 n=1 Tax=Rhodotorula toruloides TaxID=5286 RepID=A0A0K3CBH8_RHOTO|nr:Exocyst complex component, exo70 subunit [Rhodotorula toruloides ATCC 204091]KAK4334957.1 Exocyst complex protein EXO70 [Rhodotorula toruloides]PRQ76355.1 exocyst complex component, exo70 subunit [Rhodotorula toruloides]
MSSTRFPHSSSSSSTSGSIALEQANADLTLLQQSLARSSKISDRMSTVLGELDDRLARLEKSLVPIYRETGKLTRVSKNLESTMRSIDGLLGHHDLVEREEGLIKAGPKQDDLKPYLAAIDRLVSASEALRKTDAKGQSATLAQMGALIDSGARQLIGIFTKWVKETSPSMDAGKLYDQGKPFPTLTPFFLENALPLIAYLRALPDPQNTSSISSTLLSSYTSLRSAYIEESLRNCTKEVLVDATPEMVSLTPKIGTDADSAKGAGASARGAADRRGLGRVLDVLLALAKSEHALLGTVFASLPASQRTSLYSSLLGPSLTLLTNTGQSLNSLIKKSTHYALVPIAFATFQELQERQGEFEEWARTKAGRKENEVGDLTHAFRGTCLTSLPGIIEETKSWGNKAPVGTDALSAAVSPVTINVVNFMRQLTDSQATAETFLGVLGAGNWGGPSKTSTATGGDENGLLSRYLNDVFSVLLSSLDSRSRILRGRSGTGAIFLLNNVSFVRHAVLSTAIIDVLGEAAEDSLNKRMRTTKASYLEIWSPLVSALLDAGFAEQSGAAGALKAGLGAVTGGGGTERRETKDRFVRFHEALEEVEQLHQQAKLDDGDVELKERLRDEVDRMVAPTYAKFVQRHRKDNYSTKYVRLDADGLEAKIRVIFE